MANNIVNTLSFNDKEDAKIFSKKYVVDDKDTEETIFDLRKVMPIPKALLDDDDISLTFEKQAIRYMLWAQFPKLNKMPPGFVELPLPKGYKRLDTDKWYDLFSMIIHAIPFLFGLIGQNSITTYFPNVTNTDEYKGKNIENYATSYKHSLVKIRKYQSIRPGDWCINNWGCGLNSRYCVINDDTTIVFGTDWNPPLGVIEKIGKIFPKGFVYRFSDEDSFAGRCGFVEYRDGGVIKESNFVHDSVAADIDAMLAEDSGSQFRFDEENDKFVFRD